MSDAVENPKPCTPLRYIGSARAPVQFKEGTETMVAVLVVNDIGYFPFMPEAQGLAELRSALSALLVTICTREAELAAATAPATATNGG